MRAELPVLGRVKSPICAMALSFLLAGGGFESADQRVRARHSKRPRPSSSVQSGIARPMIELAGSGPKRSEEHTSELQSLMRISYAVFCLKKKTVKQDQIDNS